MEKMLVSLGEKHTYTWREVQVQAIHENHGKEKKAPEKGIAFRFRNKRFYFSSSRFASLFCPFFFFLFPATKMFFFLPVLQVNL